MSQISQKSLYSISPIAAGVAAAFGTPMTALAQEDGARPVIEEIVVTATKRGELFVIVFLPPLNCCYSQVRSDSLNQLDYNINYRGTSVIEEVQENYFETISQWITIENVHNWIKNNFNRID